MGRFSGISPVAVAGFACHQGFMFSLFYAGQNVSVEVAGIALERADLLATLLFMACAFALVRIASAKARDALLSRTLVGWYAVLLVVGSLLVVLPLGAGAAEVVAESALIGVPYGLMLCSWGRALGGISGKTGAAEALLATALGAAFCLAVSVVPASGAIDVLKLLPIGSAWALRSAQAGLEGAAKREARSGRTGGAEAASAIQDGGSSSALDGEASGSGQLSGRGRRKASGQAPSSASDQDALITFSALIAGPEERAASTRLSALIVAGTALYGLAGGFMETFSSEPGMLSRPAFPWTLLVLLLFCAAGLQLLLAPSPEGSGARREGDQQEQRLVGVYRLAILVTMAGFLFIPVLAGFDITGQAIVLAGYLGLTCVLLSLFLTMAKVCAQDAAAAFARGFMALYLGEAAGVAAGNALELAQPDLTMPYVVAACAGLATLFAYLFLFTERDFTALSVLERSISTFEQACDRMVAEFGLSKREAEVLPLALRGRTSERISQELFIAKSTADTHLRRIYAKTGVHGRQQLIDLGERMQRETPRR